jgi:hypothetical protein
MKSAAVILACAALALSSFAADVPSVNELTETLSRGPWAELPVRVVEVVRQAKDQFRKDTTIAAVKAALGLNPAAATAVVGSIARAVPSMAALAAETAAAAQPKQAPEIALAAAAADHPAAADIVTGVCRAAPDQYESVAVAVSVAVPDSGRDILKAVETAEPDLKVSIDQAIAQYKGHLPSVALVLAEARPIAVTLTQSDPTPEVRTNRPTNPDYQRYNKVPIPVGGFDGADPLKYHRP